MLKYEKGKIVTGCVTGIEKYGVFVSLDEFYNGLIHISEISDGYVKNLNDYVNIGETIKAKVVSSEENSYHVRLSIKNINYRINKMNSSKLHEISRGFLPLKEKMGEWMTVKLKEIEEKESEK